LKINSKAGKEDEKNKRTSYKFKISYNFNFDEKIQCGN